MPANELMGLQPHGEPREQQSDERGQEERRRRMKKVS